MTRMMDCVIELNGVKQEVCVEYSASGGSPGSYFHPEEPPEIEIVKAWTEPHGEIIKLTPELDEKLTDLICQALGEDDRLGSEDFD